MMRKVTSFLFAFTTFLDVFYPVSELAAIVITFEFGYVLNLRFVWNRCRLVNAENASCKL